MRRRRLLQFCIVHGSYDFDWQYQSMIKNKKQLDILSQIKQNDHAFIININKYFRWRCDRPLFFQAGLSLHSQQRQSDYFLKTYVLLMAKAKHVLIINCQLQKEMNYRSLLIQSSNFDSISNKCGEQITTLENGSEKSESLQILYRKPSRWAQNQGRCFVLFWMHRFLESPLQIYSFHAPLTRKLHFQEMSDFIRSYLGLQFYKSPQQCKTKFTAIKRRVLREIKSGKRGGAYDFYDYILMEGKQLCRGAAGEERLYLSRLIEKLAMIKSEDSEFVSLTKNIAVFQQSARVELKNNQIFKYLKELQECHA